MVRLSAEGHRSPGPDNGPWRTIGVAGRCRSFHRKFRPARSSDLILITSTTIAMKYGGSYAPYFGNLYGPPNFFFGSPFFGGFSPNFTVPSGFWPQ